ncbi:MAG: hypothetical protein LBG76_05325 [Treponema sp.]|jgi:hypothetical protein|nr:hypothetical protein [Treponema sp.]
MKVPQAVKKREALASSSKSINLTRYGSSGIRALLLALLLAPALPAQEAVHLDNLLLFGEDVRLSPSARERGFGYDLYIRQKEGVQAVQLFINPDGMMSPLFANARDYMNSVGAEILVNSSPESHDVFGRAFYFYLPPALWARSQADGRLFFAAIEEGVELHIRSLSGGDAGRPSRFLDSPFTVHMANLEAGLTAQSLSNPLSNMISSTPPYRYALLLSPGLSVFNPGPERILGEDFRLLMRFEPGGTIAFTHHLSANLGYEFRFDRDPLLSNRFIARGIFSIGGFSLEAGPFFGVFNSGADRTNPGLSMIIRANFPFANAGLSGHARLDFSLRESLSARGGYRQDQQEAGLVCAALKPFIFGFTLSNRDFSRLTEEDAVIDSGWIRYNLSARYADSGQRFSGGVNVGYQELRWNYDGAAVYNANYRYRNCYAGLEGGFLLANWELTLYLELPVYPWDYFSNPDEAFLFNANVSLRWYVE